jgi:hypothetical protein
MACGPLVVTVQINGSFLTYEQSVTVAGTHNGKSYYVIAASVSPAAPQLHLWYNGSTKWVLTSGGLGGIVEGSVAWTGDCPPLTGEAIWVYDPTGKYILVGTEIYQNPTSCINLVHGVTFEALLTSFKDCLASKSTDFLSKIRGAVQCDHLELVKLNLIIDILEQRDSESGLECVFNGKPFPGIQYCNYTPELNSNTYLETFIDFATRFCTDCIVTSTPGAPAPTPTITYLEGEAGGAITLENGNNIEF